MKGLTKRSFRAAVKRLALLDPDLGRVFRAHGFPDLLPREPGFATLVMLIIEQQVSLSSARATFARLVDAAGGELTPGSFVELDDEMLRAIGFSRQKTRYARLLAEAVVSGSFDPAALASMSDDEARRALRSLTGIGPWTAEVYLLMVMMRPDAWPTGDRALVVAAREVKRLEGDPTTEELEELGEAWRPYRAVAARILWHHYLNTVRAR